MTTKRLLLLAGTGALAYYMYKKNATAPKPKKKGMLSRFFGEMTENIKRPLDKVDDRIPETAATNTN